MESPRSCQVFTLQLLLLAASLGLSAPPTSAYQGESTTVDAIASRPQEGSDQALLLAEKVIEKMGGLDKIKKFNATAYRATGNVEQISSLSGSSNSLNCEIVAQGRKQWVSVNFMGQPVVTGYDGKQCWTMQGTNAMPTDPITAKRVKEDLDHGQLLVERLLDKGRKLSIAKPKILNGVQCQALSVVADDGKPTIFYIDPSNSLIVRSEYQGADIEQGIDCTKAYDYFDYRKVDGSLQPFRSVEYSDNKKVSVVEISKMETGVRLADDFFKMPTEAKIARLKAGPVSIPFQFTSSEIIVSASINGLPGKPFIVDTGATQSIVDTSLFQTISTKKSDEIQITTGSGAMSMGYTQLKTFQLGDIVLENVPVAVADLSKFAQFLSVRPEGLIGANILKRFLITIDYDKRELVLQDPDKVTPPAGAVVVETKPSLGVSGLAVEGVIDGKLKLSFLVDSGAAFNHVAESLIKDVSKEPLLPVGIIKGLDGTPVKTGAIRFNTLDIGGLRINEPIFSVAPSSSKEMPQGIISSGALAIIGNPLLSRYRVTIDYRNQRIYFQDTIKKTETDLAARLKKLLADYYRAEDNRETARQLSILSQDALSNGCTAVAALATANEALLSSRLAKDAQTHKAVQVKFASAMDNARNSDRKGVIAQVLALWAQYYLQDGSAASQAKARPLINKALTICPSEPAVYAVAGLLIAGSQPNRIDSHATTYGADGESTASVDAMLNQSLMLDPSNWLALWTKYTLADKAGKQDEKSLIAKHLRRYYPDALKVKQLN